MCLPQCNPIQSGAEAGGVRGPSQHLGRSPGREVLPPDAEGGVGAVEGVSQPLQGGAGRSAGRVPAQDPAGPLATGWFFSLWW